MGRRLPLSSLLLLLVGWGLLAVLAPTSGCGTSAPAPPAGEAEAPVEAVRPADSAAHAAAVERVLALDTRLAEERDHAPETVPLHEAIEDYVEALERLDFRGCPRDFVDAFAWHREAWRASIPFFEAHEELRGEMHELFDRIRAYGGRNERLLDEHVQAIFSTWEEVEAARDGL